MDATLKPYADFCLAIRMRESSNRYDCVNKFNYLGAYQFSMARLCDLGVTERKFPKSNSISNSSFDFSFPLTKELFLSSPKIQDRCFDKHVQLLKKDVIRLQGDRSVDLSGAISGCHLLGVGGLISYFAGHDTQDANGTTFTDYYKEFSGYQIP